MSANKQFPWLGVALIVTSLFLPYVSLLGILEFSGFEIMKSIGELMNEMGVDDISDGGGNGEGDTSLAGDELALAIAILMLIFSPFVFALSGLISTILLLVNKSPRIIGGLHLTFVIIFVICAAIAPTALGVISIFDFVGTGFYMGAFSSVLLFMRSHDPYYEVHSSSSYYDDYDKDYDDDSGWPWWVIIAVPMTVIAVGLSLSVLSVI
ncbi:hypothetical protein OAM96_02280 [Candidatus Poseidoniaceae archaeon]|nr:hypothetical protein [Candidatus Poseidoniaceae archaeon]